MSDEMQIAEGAELFILGDDGLLFFEPAQKLYRMNTSATYIWCLLEEGVGNKEIIASIQQAFGLSAEQAERYLHQSESVWREIGVLSDSPLLKEVVERERPEPARVDVLKDEIIAERNYRLLSSVIRMRFSDVQQLECVDPVLQHLQQDDELSASVVLDIVERDGVICLLRDGEVSLTCDDVISLAPLAKSLLWQTAVLNHDFFLDIHAGVVSDGSFCYLFPAAPGSGKSTLVTALMANGFEFFSDEIALLHEEGFTVSPAPLSICVKDAGVDVIARLYPQVRELPRHHRSDGKWVRYLPPESLPDMDANLPVGAIVFPQYAPERDTSLAPLASIDALQRLMDECLIVSSYLDVEKVGRLVRWIDDTPCYALMVSDLTEAVGLIRSLGG